MSSPRSLPGPPRSWPRGDVLLLDADPLADIHNTRKVWRTVATGAVYTPAVLWETVDFKP